MPRDILRTSLWDLRALYESELRVLTAAQKCADEWRTASSDAEVTRMLREIRKHIATLVKNNGDVASVLQHIVLTLEVDHV